MHIYIRISNANAPLLFVRRYDAAGTATARAGVGRARPSCELAFTRYCHLQYCMVYGIQRRGRWEGVYCAMNGCAIVIAIGYASQVGGFNTG